MSAEEMIVGVAGWLGPILSTCITLYVAAMVRSGEAKRDAARADTDAKRAAEAEWRDRIESSIESQGDKIDHLMALHATEMRSDLIHRAHRYMDDLGCASIEEKQAFHTQWKEYCALCEKRGIENSFIDGLAEQVKNLPNRTL